MIGYGGRIDIVYSAVAATESADAKGEMGILGLRTTRSSFDARAPCPRRTSGSYSTLMRVEAEARSVSQQHSLKNWSTFSDNLGEIYSQNFVLGEKKREVTVLPVRQRKSWTHTIVAGFSEFLFYTSAILSEHKFASMMSDKIILFFLPRSNPCFWQILTKYRKLPYTWTAFS